MRAIILSIFCTAVTEAALPGTAQWPEIEQKRDHVFVSPVLVNAVVFYEVGEVDEGHFLNEQEPQALTLHT